MKGRLIVKKINDLVFEDYAVFTVRVCYHSDLEFLFLSSITLSLEIKLVATIELIRFDNLNNQYVKYVENKSYFDFHPPDFECVVNRSRPSSCLWH